MKGTIIHSWKASCHTNHENYYRYGHPEAEFPIKLPVFLTRQHHAGKPVHKWPRIGENHESAKMVKED